MVANVPLQAWDFDLSQLNLIKRIDYDANSNAIYQGWAQAGSATTDATWRLVQNTYDGTNRFTNSAFPQDANGNPSCGFAFQWALRATYTYS
jgi:hypothetical protein